MLACVRLALDRRDGQPALELPSDRDGRQRGCKGGRGGTELRMQFIVVVGVVYSHFCFTFTGEPSSTLRS